MSTMLIVSLHGTILDGPLRCLAKKIGNGRATNCSIIAETDMKKTFRLTHPKIKAARLVESAKCNVKKYLKRERRRELPEGFDFWGFDCKFGPTAEEAKVIEIAENSKCMSAAQEQQLESFYVEILAKPVRRTKKVEPEN